MKELIIAYQNGNKDVYGDILKAYKANTEAFEVNNDDFYKA